MEAWIATLAQVIPFSGMDDYLGWEDDMEDYLKVYNIHDLEKVPHAISTLTGEP